jgi:hypothetical protein
MDRGRRTLRAEELAGDVQGLASHNDDLLAVEQLSVSWCCIAAVRARWATARRRQRVPYRGQWYSCGRGVRTMTGSNVDMAAAGVVSLTVVKSL